MTIKRHVHNTGFTLIEVLIAAIILFSSVALIAQLTGSARLTSDKATQTTAIYQTAPLVIQMIKAQVQAKAKAQAISEFSGTVMMLGVQYQWQATRTSFKAAPKDIDDVNDPKQRFGLYNIEVTAAYNQVEHRFSFEVASW